MLDYLIESAPLWMILIATSWLAVEAWGRYPRLRVASLGVLATAAGLVLYAPIRAFLHRGDSFGFAVEVLGVVGLLGFVHSGLVLFIGVFIVVRAIHEWDIANNEEQK